MNLIILIFIVVSQLIFQVLYFEEYYLNQKEKKLESTLKDFKELLNVEYDNEKIMDFIQDVKNKENIALSFRSKDLSSKIGIEFYMGDKHITLKDKNDKKRYKVILGEQFPKANIKKNDFIQVYGKTLDYGYISAEKISINGVELKPYYNIILNNSFGTDTDKVSSGNAEPAEITEPAGEIPILQDEIYIEGKVETLTNEDNTYGLFSSIEDDLILEKKEEITSNNKYTTQLNKLSSIGEVLFVSELFDEGFVTATTTISAVNEVIGTMNSYYFIVFLVAFLLVIIISLIYSKFMTKPLVEMSNVAKKISEGDFQYKYNVKSEDEIGVLGESLNLISSNLEKSLNELQDTNEKLKYEMCVKENQEEKRKEFIANISHELKTPITIIQGNINGIKSGMYNVDMYDDILDETNKMNELVKEMLEISKLESPTFKLKEEIFDLGSIFLKENDKLRSMIKEKSIEINYNDFDEAIVVGDEKRINQVVTNLLTNAIKYTPDGGKVNVSIELIEDKNQYVFSIENFGVTLSKGELDKIWDAFYRTEKSRNKKFGGTGLGLSIVKRILEVHNSDFGVASTENSVIFYFSIIRCRDY